MTSLRLGRKSNPPKIIEARPLTRDDLRHLDKRDQAVSRVAFFRETHHRLARMIAAGFRIEQVLESTGYSYQRLWTLRQDPAFQELVAQYKNSVDTKYTADVDEFRETALSNMKRMERMVEDHLDKAEEAGDLIPLKTLSSLVTDRADRFGYGKQSVKLNVNVDMAVKLERARERAEKAKLIPGRTIEGSSASPSIAPTVATTPSLRAPSSSEISSRAERGAILRQRLHSRVA